MPRPRLLSRNARRLTWLLVAVSVPPVLALLWLGGQLIKQDRDLIAQWDFDRRQIAAPLVAKALHATLEELERSIATTALPANAVRLTVASDRVTVEPRGAAAWLPVMPPLPEAGREVFAAIEADETRDPRAALAAYQALARSRNRAVRAGALMRVARRHLRDGRADAAAVAYRQLAQIKDAAIQGVPADLQARRWLFDVLLGAGRRDAGAEAAAALERDLLNGTWALDRETWHFVVISTPFGLEAGLGRPVVVTPRQRAVSELADELWRQDRAPARQARRRLVQSEGLSGLVLVGVEDDRATALVIPATTVEPWLRAAIASAGTSAPVSLLSPAGEATIGPAPITGAATVFAPGGETGLPWTLALGPGDTGDLEAAASTRRGLLGAGLAAVLALVAGSSILVWRVMQRELAVARLQTEFVAAVSHEFRTPLTALRHVTDLLEESDDVPVERRRQFYQTLGRNTDRLQRLVESLLDFSRMESGRQPYDLRIIDVVALVEPVVADFQRDAAGAAVVVLRVAPDAPRRVRADPVSLSTAIWNLLDNAVKYSPAGAVVEVDVVPHSSGVAIMVRDRGIGIPDGEQHDVFERFVRGADAGVRGVPGTGLGLALVRHIVAAHGGSIALESVHGAGSTFTIALPEASCRES